MHMSLQEKKQTNPKQQQTPTNPQTIPNSLERSCTIFFSW